MKKIKVAINGFGRIGRAFYKVSKEYNDIEVVAINDLGSIDAMKYLLKYDTVYGQSDITLDGVKMISEKDPTKLPWKELDIDVVVESTGLYVATEKAVVHLQAGAKRVVITAPIKDDDSPTVLMAVNEDKLKGKQISSNASCTTNAANPLITILDEALGIEKALLNTVHAYTATQALVDGPSKKDLREGRAAAQNIVPSSTGAAIAVTKVVPHLTGKFDGISIRVPVPVGSIVDVTFISKKRYNSRRGQ
jgi:glyceraldehyde 3-phosphate dehydrogenase